MINSEGLDVGPFYMAMSASLDRRGDVTYRYLSMERPERALVTQSAGLARPSCGHLHCRLFNLAQAAADWAWARLDGDEPGEIHGETLAFEVGPE